MLFVIKKSELQGAISIVRDDRTKKSRGFAGPFLQLEANENYVKLDGNEVSAKIAATVYEPGVLFLKVTMFRRVLKSITKQKFLTIQVMSDGLLLENVSLPLETNDMLLYLDPILAPRFHPSVALLAAALEEKRKKASRQLLFWDLTDSELADDGC